MDTGAGAMTQGFLQSTQVHHSVSISGKSSVLRNLVSSGPHRHLYTHGVHK